MPPPAPQLPACGSHPAPRRRRSRLSTRRILASLIAPHHCIPRGSSTPPVERSSATAAAADTNAPASRGTRDLGSQLGGVKRRCSQWGRGRPRAPETGASPARKRQRGRRRRRRREDGGAAAARRKRAIAPRRRSGARRAARSCPRGTGTARRCPHLYFRRLDLRCRVWFGTAPRNRPSPRQIRTRSSRYVTSSPTEEGGLKKKYAGLSFLFRSA